MGLEKEKSRRQYGPQDLGILDSPPSRGIRTVVELCAVSLKSPIAALFVFDDTASELFLNAAFGLEQMENKQQGLPLTGSVASFARGEIGGVRIDDLATPPFDTSVEHLRFGARSYLGDVVRGPANEPIGVLSAMRHKPSTWTLQDNRLIGDLAYLLSQQIMLKASFATLKIMSSERKTFAN